MMLTLACSCMDAATESEFIAAFTGVDAHVRRLWELTDVEQAQHVIVDMDSASGPMSWIRLHNAGKYVIALTMTPRARTNYHLERPLGSAGLGRLLANIARHKGLLQTRPPTTGDTPAPAPTADGEAPAMPLHFNADAIAGIDPALIRELLNPAPPSSPPRTAPTTSPAGGRWTPEEEADFWRAAAAIAPWREPPAPLQPPHERDHDGWRRSGHLVPESPINPMPVTADPPPADPQYGGGHDRHDHITFSSTVDTLQPRPVAHAASPPPEPERRPAAAATEPPVRRHDHLRHWLRPGRLDGRVRLRSSRAPTLYIDANARRYYGPATLKPLTGAFDGEVDGSEFEALPASQWEREIALLGPARPLERLQWYAALLAGKGKLRSDLDPAGRFELAKWPETEREFPRHFRIATAMMKGPATLDEIAAASTTSVAEVADFINANMAGGHIRASSDQNPA